MYVREIIQHIGTYLDAHSLTQASCVSRAWYTALAPLREQEYHIGFRLWPLRPWEWQDEKYSDLKQGQFPGLTGDEVIKKLLEMKKVCRDFLERRHLIRTLHLGHHAFPLQGWGGQYRDDNLLQAFNLQLHHMLFSDATMKEPQATPLTNLTELNVNLLPLSLLMKGFKPWELFKVWDPRRRLQDIDVPSKRIREALIRTFKELPELHDKLYTTIHACTWQLIRSNPRLASLCVVQLSDDLEDSFAELGLEDQEYNFLAPELHNFLATLSQARSLTQLTSLSLVKFDWPRYSVTRLLAILRQTTPNLEELTIIFRLYNSLRDLQVDESLLNDDNTSDSDKHLPPLRVKYLHLSSFRLAIPPAFNQMAPEEVFYQDNNKVKQALFSFLKQFPLLEEWRMTGSDCRGRKASLETRASLRLTDDRRIVTPRKERSQCREIEYFADFSYYWYSGNGPASATTFCQEIQHICPRLKALDFSRYQTFRPMVMQAFVNTYNTQLETLDMFGNPGFNASALVQAIRVCTNLTTLDISFCHRSSDYLEEYYAAPYAPLFRFDEELSTFDCTYECEGEILCQHKNKGGRGSLAREPVRVQQHIQVVRPGFYITGREASLALWKLPHLKRFYAQEIPIDARDLLFEYDIAHWDKTPKQQQWRVKMPWGRWACQKLEVLAIKVMVPSGVAGFDDRDDFIRQDIAKAKEEALPSHGMDMDVDKGVEMGESVHVKKKRRAESCSSSDNKDDLAAAVTAKEVRQMYEARVCEQLGQLTRLRELLLEGKEEVNYDGVGRETMGSLSLSINTGLTALAPLAHSLERLCVYKLKDKLAGRAEVEWIAKNLYNTSLDPRTVAGRLQRQHQQSDRPEPTRTNF
ncbi:hypothetical protein BGZ73_000709, partial [Actinomortierella ambigua]